MPKHRSPSDYAALGTKVASDYLTSGVPLTQALKKIAQDEDLNTHQIERVAEAANHRTFQELFPKRAGGDVSFDPASAESVIADLNAPVKIAADTSDYNFRPDVLESPDLETIINREFGGKVAELLPELEKRASQNDRSSTSPRQFDWDTWKMDTLEEFEKVATEQQASFDRLDNPGVVTRYTLIQLKEAAEHFNVERMRIANMATVEVEKFAQIIHRLVRSGQKVEDLYKAAMLARPDQKEALTGIFGKVISDLEHSGTFGGYRKTAGKVNPALISDRLSKMIPPHGCTVINSSHPLTLSVNVLADLSTQWEEANKGHAIARDALEKAKKVITHIGPEAKVQGL